MHIDPRVVKNLLTSRINEGRELMKSPGMSAEWKKRERTVQEKFRAAIKLIDEAINIEEGKQNEVSKTPDQSISETNEGVRKPFVQNQGPKA